MTAIEESVLAEFCKRCSTLHGRKQELVRLRHDVENIEESIKRDKLFCDEVNKIINQINVEELSGYNNVIIKNYKDFIASEEKIND